ncbi:restriction endonuclease subunit S [Lysobacter gummosus]|uniref:Restriction endonuclease subunit S n=1 Tax=Lysobacter gummosus TaxID=262324 RepID=A0ABY3XGI7_9GAMM|nr:restriction endonuclease subunit S [Lysobacter gummosus]UNP30732.1 restriction endonuclease subunit S [Lysobacter gummosus]
MPLFSVTMNDGLVDREQLERKQETNLSAKEHLLVKPGDIAYNTMRMWQGAFGLADREGLVSPAYVVLKPRADVDPLYASYLFKTPRMSYLFWAYSYGLTDDRLRLYPDDFMRIPVSIPALPVQMRTARLLSEWDQAISATERLFSLQTDLHKKILADLTVGRQRLPGFESEWASVRLGAIGGTYGGLSGKSREDFGHGKPFVPYANIFANSKIDLTALDLVDVRKGEAQNACRYGDIFFTASSETPEELGTASVLLEEVEELYLNSFCVGFRLHNFSVLLPEFARFLFRGPALRRSLDQIAQGYTRFNLSKPQLMKLHIHVPAIEEQRRIAALLDTSERQVLAHAEQISSLKSEKFALMQRLLGGKRGTPTDELLEAESA